ncbi:MAG: RagB/SusD family nutrient uptake outer membrane protein [Chitinophagaceae bacterium]
MITKTSNKLRSRVAIPGLTIATLVKDPKSDFLAVPVLIDEIKRERRIELVMEGFRFDDLLCWKAGKQIENPESILGLKLHVNVKAKYPPK